MLEAAAKWESMPDGAPSQGQLVDLLWTLWNDHLSPVARALVGLVEKTGKAPKERLLLRDAGQSQTDSVTFLGWCAAILELMGSLMAEPESASSPPSATSRRQVAHEEGMHLPQAVTHWSGMTERAEGALRKE